jgi:Mrp family chromosome partitioning ATPase/LPS O-antigen subunit length determinant protein (WzzB/FepE family)
MLDAPVASAEAVWSAPQEPAQTMTLADAMVFLRQQFWLIAGAAAVMLALAIVYVLLTPATYVGRAELLIEPGKQPALWQDNGVVDLTIDNAQVESQVEVLLSERIANDVIDKLGLINDPEFRTSGSDYERRRAALGHFENSLSARRIGQSYVIEVSFRSRDPEKAAQITNAVTDAYLRDQQQAKQDVANQASQWMEAQIAELGVELNAAAAAAQEFRVSHGITDTSGNNGQPQLIDKLTALEAKAEAYRKVYEGLLERFTQDKQQASYPVSNARVITSASRPLAKTYPKTKLILLLAILIGLVIGIAVASARVILDGSVRGAKQVRQALGLAVLGLLPKQRPEQAAEGLTPDRVEVIDAPLSPFSEAMRNVKLSVERACGSQSGCCLGILSLEPEEATSTVAVNLAALFAASRARTVLVDADFRERRLTRRLIPQPRIGLAEALRDGDMADTLLVDPKTNAHILPIGSRSPVANPADLLDSPALPALLAKLKERFATVLVAPPPLQSASDARAVAPLLDGCILVATHGRTSLRALEDAVELLRADNVSLFGVVLTDVSKDIPPLFGVHFAQLRDFDYADFVQRLARSIHERRRGAAE